MANLSDAACPTCGAVFHNFGQSTRPNALTVCNGCGEILRHGKHGQAEKLPTDELFGIRRHKPNYYMNLVNNSLQVKRRNATK